MLVNLKNSVFFRGSLMSVLVCLIYSYKHASQFIIMFYHYFGKPIRFSPIYYLIR